MIPDTSFPERHFYEEEDSTVTKEKWEHLRQIIRWALSLLEEKGQVVERGTMPDSKIRGAVGGKMTRIKLANHNHFSFFTTYENWQRLGNSHHLTIWYKPSMNDKKTKVLEVLWGGKTRTDLGVHLCDIDEIVWNRLPMNIQKLFVFDGSIEWQGKFKELNETQKK